VRYQISKGTDTIARLPRFVCQPRKRPAII
jgi:hypothetical protein